MAAYGEWITKSARIGAALGGVAGFFYAVCIMATSHALSWTDISDTMESVVVVLITAVMIGSLCIGIGGLAGLVLGIVASPLSSFRQETEVKKGTSPQDPSSLSETRRGVCMTDKGSGWVCRICGAVPERGQQFTDNLCDDCRKIARNE
jgi:hypothetical protein